MSNNEIRYSSVLYLRDVDGTGSLHLCDANDEGAICYIPAKTFDAPDGDAIWSTEQETAEWDATGKSRHPNSFDYEFKRTEE